jgi:hypothetical protein
MSVSSRMGRSMATYVRIVSFETKGGRFDDRKDSAELGKILSALQEKEATIDGITHRLVHSERNGLTIAVYLIQYDADSYLDV